MAATVANAQAQAQLGGGAAGHGVHEGDAGPQQQQSSSSVEPLPPAPRFKPSDFTLVRTLGTGTFARVCLVRPATAADRGVGRADDDYNHQYHQEQQHEQQQQQQQEQQVYALKILRKTEVIKLKQVDHVRHERAILADVAGHPFITNLLASFADRDSLYMLLDYVPGGEIFSYLRRLRRFDEPVARFYAAEIVLVLEYLHEHQGGVAYRDLKPENLLLDRDGHIKLVDFGFAKRLGYKGGSDNDNGRPVETYTLCGTPEYLAPEVIHNKGHTTAVDWWALGILIYEFLTGYPPFWHQNPIEIYKQIVEKPVVFPQDPPLSPDAKDLIRSFCTTDRSRRLGNISGGAARVKAHPWFADVDWDAVLARRGTGPIVPPVRYPGDAQCFDTYPEDDGRRADYTDDMARKYDHYFEDF